jgi:hypothetical protein
MNAPLSDTILFELPEQPDASSLCLRLRPRWPASLVDDGGPCLVAAELRPDAADLARLLRDVETWVAERGLEELWFQLDGRSYLLEPKPSPTAA